MIERTLGRTRKAADPAHLAQGVEAIHSPGQQLVGVGLVPHVPDDPIPAGVEDAQQGQSQFDHAQGRSQMTARCRHGLDDHAAKFFAQPDQLLFIHGLHVAGMLNGGQNGKKFLQGLRGHESS